MDKEQKDKFYDLCVEYRCNPSVLANASYLKLRDYVETLIDEAVKAAINVQNRDKTE